MGLTMRERQSLVRVNASRYQEGEQEGEEQDSGRVRAIDWISSDLRGLAIREAREANSGWAENRHCWRHSEACPEEA